MPDLPRSVETTLATFAASLGIEPVAAADGAVSFSFEKSGRLSVVATQIGDVVISLTRPVIVEGAANLARVAALAEVGATDGQNFHAGLSGAGQPVLMTRVIVRELDPSRLEQIFDALRNRCADAGI